MFCICLVWHQIFNAKQLPTLLIWMRWINIKLRNDRKTVCKPSTSVFWLNEQKKTFEKWEKKRKFFSLFSTCCVVFCLIKIDIDYNASNIWLLLAFFKCAYTTFNVQWNIKQPAQSTLQPTTNSRTNTCMQIFI